MLTIYIPAQEGWDEEKEQFVEYRKARTIQLEHSLVSISKWESITEKTFLSNKNISTDETLLYIKCMTITQNVFIIIREISSLIFRRINFLPT